MATGNRWIAAWTTALGLSLVAFPVFSQPQYLEDFVTGIPDGSRGMTSGPGVGERIPDFEALDQHGNLVSLSDVMGPSGAMVVFIRSADW